MSAVFRCLAILGLFVVGISGQCSFMFNGTLRTFSQCTLNAADFVGFSVYWNFLNNTYIEIAARLALADSTNFIAMGFSHGGSTPMVTSYAVIGYCTPNRLSHYINEFYLSAQSETAIYTSNDLEMNSTLVDNDGTTTTLLFVRPLVSSVVPSIIAGNPTEVIFSYGAWDSTMNKPTYHGVNRNYGSINFLTGEIALGPVDPYKYAHAFLMTFSWGLFLPLGLLFARFGKGLGPIWFQFHRGLQTFGLILATIGFGIGVGKIGSGTYKTHYGLGIVIMILGWIQPLNAFFRPHAPKENEQISDERRKWNYFHRTIGHVAVTLAIIQIFIGFGILNPPVGSEVAYDIVLILFVLAYGSLQVHRLWQEKRPDMKDMKKLDTSPPPR